MRLKLRKIGQRSNQGNKQENMLQKADRFSSNFNFLIILWVLCQFLITYFCGRDFTLLKKRTLELTEIFPENVHSRILAKSQ